MCNFVLQLKYNVKNNNNNTNMQWFQKSTHLSHKHNLFESSCHDNITKPNTFKLVFTELHKPTEQIQWMQNLGKNPNTLRLMLNGVNNVTYQCEALGWGRPPLDCGQGPLLHHLFGLLFHPHHCLFGNAQQTRDQLILAFHLLLVKNNIWSLCIVWWGPKYTMGCWLLTSFRYLCDY